MVHHEVGTIVSQRLSHSHWMALAESVRCSARHGSDHLDVERTGKPKGVKQGAPRYGVAVLSRGRKDAEGGGSGPSAGTVRGGSHVREEVGLFGSNPTPTSGGAHSP